jgi:hypothetical protein
MLFIVGVRPAFGAPRRSLSGLVDGWSSQDAGPGNMGRGALVTERLQRRNREAFSLLDQPEPVQNQEAGLGEWLLGR